MTSDNRPSQPKGPLRAALTPSRGLVLRLTVVVASGAIVLWRLDVPGAVGRLTDVDLRWVLPGLVAFTLSKFVHAFRWRRLLGRHRELTTRRLAPVFLLSNMVNALIPFRVGDLLRVELPSRRFGVPRAELASSVFVVESVLDGVAFVILIGLALQTYDLPKAARPLVGGASIAAIVLFGAAVVASRSRSSQVAGPWTRWLPPPVRRRLGVWVPQFIEGMQSLRSNGALIRAVVISLVAWSVEVPLYWMMARAFGLELSVPGALVIMIAANLIVSVPLTPWDVGPYEIVVTEAYVLLGADRLDASAFAIGSHLLLQLWIGTTGLVAMVWLGMRPGELLTVGARQAAPR